MPQEPAGWRSFEPWLSRIEALDQSKLWAVAEAVPPEWYGGDPAVLEQLMETLYARRGRVRELLAGCRDSNRAPFPIWVTGARVTVPGSLGETPVASKFVM